MDCDTLPLLGANVYGDGVNFTVWAPKYARMEIELENGRSLPLTLRPGGYHESFVPGLTAGACYRFRLDRGALLPDPASRFQPEGVHGPSEVVDPGRFAWNDGDWEGVAAAELIVYELHVGTFSPEGTFNGVTERLEHLQQLGVTAIELMPIAAFAGRWNWGYDPAAWLAPAAAYGRPDDLRRLVDEAHRRGIAVLLDVVYNHFGPDGAYAPAYAPYLTEAHATPWGRGINLDCEDADGVRRFIVEGACRWLTEYHLDGLRLDAIFTLIDGSPQHLLAELSEAVQRLPGPKRLLIAEDERNDRTVVEPPSAGGLGLDAVWADDFHHQVRNTVAGDAQGYYIDFCGGGAHAIARIINRGWLFCGEHSRYRNAPRGSDPSGLDSHCFVFCIQNHDQIGNRPEGDRLHHAIDWETFRATTALLLLTPQVPLLFMGQEWGATSPFQYFTDHNPELGELVRVGRQREFATFLGFSGEVPDPQAETTFRRSKLMWSEIERSPHAGILAMTRDLIAWRRKLSGAVVAEATGDLALVLRRDGATLLVGLGGAARFALPSGAMRWHSEQPDYCPASPSAPPTCTAGSVTLSRPGAALFVR